MTIIKNLFPIILLIFSTLFLSAQKKEENTELKEIEDSLKIIAPEILYGRFDFNKYESNEKFYSMLNEALLNENSFSYPFDSLKTISILKSPDKYFRIFTWNLRKTDGSYDYFGIIQINPKKIKGDGIFKLSNNTLKNANSAQEILTNENWYGALYYKIIQTKTKENTYYSFLGWDGNNGRTTRKIIDVLVFDNSGQPEFGAPIFQIKEELKSRFIIEYGANVSVSLKYEKQYLSQGKNKKLMIVFDRVSPLTPGLEGQYQFYVPETDTYDAFVFEKGVWQFYGDVDARNPKEKNKVLNKNKSEQQKRNLQQDK